MTRRGKLARLWAQMGVGSVLGHSQGLRGLRADVHRWRQQEQESGLEVTGSICFHLGSLEEEHIMRGLEELRSEVSEKAKDQSGDGLRPGHGHQVWHTLGCPTYVPVSDILQLLGVL